MSAPLPPAVAGARAPGHVAPWRWVGLAGSALLALGATGAGVLPRPDPLADTPVLRVLRTGAGPAVCVAIAALGTAVLLLAWWRSRDEVGAGVRRVTVTAAWWAAPLAVAPPLFSRDVYSYAAQGALLATGRDPYVDGVSALRAAPTYAGWVGSVSGAWLDTPAPYGPLFLALARGAAELSGGRLLVAVLLLRLVAVGGLILIGFGVPRLARACGVDPARAQWLAVANPLVLVHLVSGAHNEAPMAGLLVLGLAVVATVARRAGGRTQGTEPAAGEDAAVPQPPAGGRAAVVGASALVGLAVAVKATAGVALPFVVLLRAGRTRGAAALVRAGAEALVVAVAVFAAVSVATGLGLGWVGALTGTPGASVQWTSVPTGLGLAAGEVAGWFGRPDLADPLLAAVRAAATVATAAILVVLWWRVRRRGDDPRAVVATAGAALAVVVVLAAAFHPWYAVWAIVPLAAAGPRRVRTGLAVASTALCFLVLPDGYNLARATAGPGVVLDVVSAGVALVLAVRWLRARRRRSAGPRASPTGVLR